MHEDLNSATLLAEGVLGTPGVGTPTITAINASLNGPLCTFHPGDGDCEDSGCTERLLASDAPNEQQTWASRGFHVQGRVNSQEECAMLVVQREPSANGATYTAGDSVRQGDCYAEFGMTSIVEGHMYDQVTGVENDGLTWDTCFLEPTDNLVNLQLQLVGGGNVTISAQCKMEMAELESEGLKSVETCEAVGTTIMLIACIFIAVCCYHFAHVLYGLEKSQSGGLALGNVDEAQGHVRMDDHQMSTGSNGVFESDSTSKDANPVLPTFTSARP